MRAKLPGAHSVLTGWAGRTKRGLRGHVETELEVLRTLDIEPRSPPPQGPNVDVAWEHDGTVYVAEIMSTTDRNEERQLRLGLGQALRYRSMIASRTSRRVGAVLVPERRPRDDTWKATCENVGVHLVPRDDQIAQLPQVLRGSALGPTESTPREP
jgi:hypothetical protein